MRTHLLVPVIVVRAAVNRVNPVTAVVASVMISTLSMTGSFSIMKKASEVVIYKRRMLATGTNF